jgi:Uma2 family endonuclease
MNVLVPPPAAESPPRLAPGEQRLLLNEVSWDAYRAIGEALRDRPALRMTYDRGRLELMTTSPEHEKLKKRLARLIETLAEECGLAIEPAGNMTFQREDLQRGLEPDDCFWVAHEPQVRGRSTWEPGRDPPPDLALEIEISRSALSRMEVYAALGVPEVWRFDGTTLLIQLLQADGSYRAVDQSPTFPKVPPAELVRFAQLSGTTDYLGLIRSFREWVRERLLAQ